MSITEDPLAPVDEPYQRQMTSYRRTRSAILDGAKALIAIQGLQRANMVEIADTAQVSRATLYNHFRDKGSVMRALMESEVHRIFEFADEDTSRAEALAKLSIEVSTDPALARLRVSDPAVLTTMLASIEDPLWDQIRIGLTHLMGDSTVMELTRLWLVGQVLQPLTLAQSREQAEEILR